MVELALLGWAETLLTGRNQFAKTTIAAVASTDTYSSSVTTVLVIEKRCLEVKLE